MLVKRISFPPPLIFFICAGIMYLLPQWGTFYTPYFIVTLTILVAITIALLSLREFYYAKTTINPSSFEKTTHLITTGVFRISRNPMYVSLWLLLLSWFLYLGNSVGMLGLVLFVWIMNSSQIRKEERALLEKFGEEYHCYCQRVKRWL